MVNVITQNQPVLSRLRRWHIAILIQYSHTSAVMEEMKKYRDIYYITGLLAKEYWIFLMSLLSLLKNVKIHVF